MDNKMNCNSFNVDSLIKHFLNCTPINTIDILNSEENINCLVNSKKQQEILERTVNSDLIKKYPIKRSYQRAFLKWLMKKIEDEGGEIYDEDNCISIKESTSIISEGTTGLCSWQGAIELSKWCLGNKEKFFGKVILELGCGVGLTGLSIIKTCFPKQYIFTDCHKIVLEMAFENIQLNLVCNERKIESALKYDRFKSQLRCNYTDVKIEELRWEDINKYVNEQWVLPDIIIGADILYDTDSFLGLVTGLKGFLSYPNRCAIIAVTVRNKDTVLRFLHQLAYYDLLFKKYIPRQTVHQKSASEPIKILKIYHR
ncbi:protein-lysine N-methyltransferase EEF2KMT isoform X2 [Bombus vancouverensis nearcticus]|uniref:protein-lysine N-methyltransferase EEF2KMT isoform X2 n=1 Tax=Bombus vancouverensis nearcticus TaxID=2705178 RepID=UPI001439CA95|nr:putative protein N-methyltransferase FAM86B1 isoform X2 [Bombus vancouverensis nearcticus]